MKTTRFNNTTSTINGNKENKNMKRQDRTTTLANNGIDTNNYFSLNFNSDMFGKTITIIGEDGKKYNLTLNEAINNGADEAYKYIFSDHLHRRWVMAQTLRMLKYPTGWNGYVNDRLSYKYMFTSTLDELNVLRKMEKDNDPEFEVRKKFFTLTGIKIMTDEYLNSLNTYIDGLVVKKHKGVPYKTIIHRGYVYTKNINENILFPIFNAKLKINIVTNYEEMYDAFKDLYEVAVILPNDTIKCKTWKEMYKGAGAYYTMQNMIRFHGCSFYESPCAYELNSNYQEVLLNHKLEEFGWHDDYEEFYKLHAVLKEFVAYNENKVNF